MILATLSDKNYILNGLALYESLLEHKSNFSLFYLCVDKETEEILRRLNLEHIVPVSLEGFDSDPSFILLKKYHESKPIDTSDGQSPFHWALGSLLTNYLLNIRFLPHCLYVDSDICFYDNLNLIAQSVTDYDVGVVTHKHMRLEKTRPNVGYYNVGIIYFANSAFGSACCRWWRDVVIDTQNPWFHPFGSCGDQKYLEIFTDIFPFLNMKVMDLDIGHSAPWNMGPSKLEDGNYTWPSENVIPGSHKTTQKLVFHHFSHFTPNFDNNTYSHQRDNEWGNCVDTPEKVNLHNDYFMRLLKVKEKYGI